jgi:hypothetical protein
MEVEGDIQILEGTPILFKGEMIVDINLVLMF